MGSELVFDRDGVRLAGIDFGGDGPPVLLLHGLAGYAGEWAETAGWLSERARVVALDARGHGGSERFPADVSRAAHLADAALAVERLRLGPVVVVGQSLGGLTALLLAAERPDLVRGLVMVEAGPGGGGDASSHDANVAALGLGLPPSAPGLASALPLPAEAQPRSHGGHFSAASRWARMSASHPACSRSDSGWHRSQSESDS